MTSMSEILRIIQELEKEANELDTERELKRARRIWREFVEPKFRNLIDARIVNDRDSTQSG